MAKFHYQSVFTFQVIQENAFLVSCLGIWTHHAIQGPLILKSKYLKKENNFWRKIKDICLFQKFTLLDLKFSLLNISFKYFKEVKDLHRTLQNTFDKTF